MTVYVYGIARAAEKVDVQAPGVRADEASVRRVVKAAADHRWRRPRHPVAFLASRARSVLLSSSCPAAF